MIGNRHNKSITIANPESNIFKVSHTMGPEEISTASTDEVTASISHVVILGEIVGATNLVAALREEKQEAGSTTSPSPSSSPSSSHQPKAEFVNAFCNIYFGDTLIHRTKTISKNNNPIWACDTGSLFKIEFDIVDDDDETRKDLKIEVLDHVGKNKTVPLGVAVIPRYSLITGEICNEKRMQFELHKDRVNVLKHMKSDKKLSDVWESIGSFTPTLGMLWPVKEETLPESEDEVDEDDSIYGGKSVATFDPSDDFIFGQKGTIALRFRIATKEDVGFLKAVATYNDGFRYARKKNKQALAKVKNILDSNMQRVAQMKAQIVSEGSSVYTEVLNCGMVNEMIDYRIYGNLIDEIGVNRLRVKPSPDPNRPISETKFLTEAEMLEKCHEGSHSWMEAGSGSIGQVRVEILSCEGLPNKDFGRMFGNKSDPFACIVYEDCLVQTDMISDCLNPMWMPWSQRAFVFNRMHELSSIHIGVFNHKFGPIRHNGCGRVTIDLKEFKPNTVYTLKYELFSSPILTNRKSKGTITIRLQLTDNDAEKKNSKSIQSIVSPPIVHVNVKRRKTLDIARYTCYGKYREDVYNMKILRSYVDEILENIEFASFELKMGLKSLIFWQGQVRFGRVNLPLHSFLAFVSATYVIEQPHLIPAYIFFCAAWCMLFLMCRQNRDPYPWSQTGSFSHHLKSFVPYLPTERSHGESIYEGQGFKEKQEQDEERKKIMEEDKMLHSKIARVRRELEQILAAVSEVNLDTYEGVGGLNPLSRLLPVQLILRDVIYYVRWIKKIICCKDSQLSFLLTMVCIFVGMILFFLPITKMVHWICKIIIWVFLGPWMRLADMAYKRKSSIEVNSHLKRVMHEIQEREQKRFNEARILREEAMKLKAARILRFGRFAVKVPSVNVTRFYDYPLTESTARPTNGNDNGTITERISKYVPGQKDYGVMIPELTKPSKMRNDEKKVREARLKKLKTTYKKKRDDTRGNGRSKPFFKGEIDLGSSNRGKANSKIMPFNVEPREAFEFNSQSRQVTAEGFELIATQDLARIRVDCECDAHKSEVPTKPPPEEREQQHSETKVVSDERETNCMEVGTCGEIDVLRPQESATVQIQGIMSDLTFDI